MSADSDSSRRESHVSISGYIERQLDLCRARGGESKTTPVAAQLENSRLSKTLRPFAFTLFDKLHRRMDT